MKVIIKEAAGFRIEVKGHANYAEHGKDIVCAAVSTLFYSLLNYAHKSKNLIDFQIKDSDSFVEAKVPYDVSLLIMTGLESIAEDYPDNVQIEKIKEDI